MGGGRGGGRRGGGCRGGGGGGGVGVVMGNVWGEGRGRGRWKGKGGWGVGMRAIGGRWTWCGFVVYCVVEVRIRGMAGGGFIGVDVGLWTAEWLVYLEGRA